MNKPMTNKSRASAKAKLKKLWREGGEMREAHSVAMRKKWNEPGYRGRMKKIHEESWADSDKRGKRLGLIRERKGDRK